MECGRQFVIDPKQKLIDETTLLLVKRSLLEKVSLEGVCRIFEVSMTWLLTLIDGLIDELPKDLNAYHIKEGDEFEVIATQVDELWSFVGNKKNDQWLFLIQHQRTRQILAMEVGKRDKNTAERLFAKLPTELKKKPSTSLISSMFILKLFHPSNIDLSVNNQVKQATLRDLIIPLDSVVLV
jgi:hypothetical protein